MDQEVNRVRIKRLYSQNNIFDEIVFHEGINLILGEKFDESTVRGRKTNGVGKSMCVEFLNFIFLCDYKRSRISKIPTNVLPMGEYIIADLIIGENELTIQRNRKNEDKPIIICNKKTVAIDKLQDARDYLTELIFKKLDGKAIPSFRSLFSLLMRNERSEFSDIIKPHDIRHRIPDDLSVHLFLLGLSVQKYRDILFTIKKIDEVNNLIKSDKKVLTQDNKKKISDVQAELNAAVDELNTLEEAIESFKTHDAYKSLEKEISEIEESLESLRNRQKILSHEYKNVMSLPELEHVEDKEVALVYNSFKEQLGDAVVKSLNETIEFKNKVEKFQRLILNQRAAEIRKEQQEIERQISLLDDEHAAKIKIIDTKGILKNLKMSLKIYNAKKDDVAHIQYTFTQYEQNKKTKTVLESNKLNYIVEVEKEKENDAETLRSFESTILDIHENIMGNRECSFAVTINERTKAPIKIELRIYDDGSHSVDRTKVFIYDMALMFNKYTSQRHPLFLVHDNIFDVDQDTLVQCLNYVYKQEKICPDFQYILTLNRDKIENEERRSQIDMDIEAHQVAVFTKDDKFLNMDYQELDK